MDYSSEVLRRFAAPSRIADRDLPGSVAGSAQDRSLNLWVRFQACAADGYLSAVRFNAFGCPQLIAAADWFAEKLEGQPVAALRGLDLARVTDELEVPRTKVGKLLRIEDALTACAEQLERET